MNTLSHILIHSEHETRKSKNKKNMKNIDPLYIKNRDIGNNIIELSTLFLNS